MSKKFEDTAGWKSIPLQRSLIVGTLSEVNH